MAQRFQSLHAILHSMDGEEELITELQGQPHGLTFTQALADVARGNAEFVDREKYLTRLKICNECPHKVKVVNVCGICKCVLPLKARFQRANCPDNRW